MSEEIQATTANPSPEAAAEPFSWMDESPAAEPNPEPTAEVADESPSPETVDPAQPPEETGDDWLPDEQEKQFPVDTLAKYAKRFGYSPEEVQADPRLQRTLKDKLNSDILIRQMQQEPEEPTQEEPAEEAAEPQAPQPITTEQAQTYLKNITANIDSYVEPQIANPLMSELITALGGDGKEYKPEQLTNIAKALMKMMVVGQHTLYSDPRWSSWAVKQGMGSAYEGFDDSYQSQSRAGAWDGLRKSSPEYKALPTFGSPEYEAAMAKVADLVPGFENFTFRDPHTGQAASPYRNFQEKSKIAARVMAKLASGASPAEAASTVQAARSKVQEDERKRKAGKALGSGQGSRQFASDTSKDDFKSMIADYNSKQKSF